MVPFEKAAFEITNDGTIRANADKDRFDLYCKGIDKQKKRLAIERAAAMMVGLLRENEWLALVDINLSPSSEYDDEGYYRLVEFYCPEIRTVPGLEVPDYALVEGTPNAYAVADLLNELVDDWREEFYEAVAPYPDSYDDLRFVVERERLADLLTHDVVHSGAAAMRLFPVALSALEHDSEVRS
jgi:hypothetical protein